MAEQLRFDLPAGFVYDLVVRTEHIGGRAYELVLLRDFEAAVTELCDRVLAGADRRWFEDLCPMFGVVWPSARALAAIVARDEVAGLRVVELGCGLGLPSLVAASRGAIALATDQHPHAERFLAENARRNGLAVGFAAVDWRALGAIGPVDRVLASDVLYAANLVELVADAFVAALAPDGVGWLADPGRPWLDEFRTAAAARGLAHELQVEDDTFVLRLTRTR